MTAEYIVHDRKKEFKRKGLCKFGRLAIWKNGESWTVRSDSGNTYRVQVVDGKYLCECASQNYVCRHVKAVHQVEEKILEERIRLATKESTQAMIKNGYLHDP